VPTAGQVGFKFAPRINAAGRMSTAMTAFELLSTDVEDQVDELPRFLNDFNKGRQEEGRVVEEAVTIVGV
jgi:single-stranded-DNA-specific exonuclease